MARSAKVNLSQMGYQAAHNEKPILDLVAHLFHSKRYHSINGFVQQLKLFLSKLQVIVQWNGSRQ